MSCCDKQKAIFRTHTFYSSWHHIPCFETNYLPDDQCLSKEHLALKNYILACIQSKKQLPKGTNKSVIEAQYAPCKQLIYEFNRQVCFTEGVDY
jgi:hypothetical protein